MSHPPSSTLVIFGAGGHGRVVADAALRSGGWSRIVATDRDAARCTGELLPGVPLLPLDTALALPQALVHVAIGSAGHREREAAPLAGRLATVVHPQACVSRFAVIEPGCFVAAQSVVAPGARLGTAAIVNHGAVVDHDVEVGAFSHLAPRATLGGGARIGTGVLVGAGATVLPLLEVCEGAVVGAGAVVRSAIRQPGTYAGVPAARVR